MEGVHAHLAGLLDQALALRQANERAEPSPDAGSAGERAFVDKLVATQMFSNYVHALERSEAEPKDEAPLALAPADSQDLARCRRRCGGAMDTPLCTLLCARTWESRARSRKAQSRIRQAEMLRSQGPRALDDRKLEPKRHVSETESQWKQRAKMHSPVVSR